MKKLIWASLDDYISPHKSEKLVGRCFANYNFFNALIKYGHFDEYHFFLINRSHKREFEENHREFLKKIDAESKIKLFFRTEMPKIVSENDYTVFHQADHMTYFNSLCYFRNKYSSFPVTSFIHSMSYSSMMLTLQEMLLGGVTKKDAIICSSECGRNLLLNFFKEIESIRNLPSFRAKLEVIPFGFDSCVFDGIKREESRERLGLSKDEIIGLSFGRFSEYDKMDLFPLLQAFQKIYRRGYPFRLILAGAAHQPQYVKMVKLWAKALELEDAVLIMTNISEKEKLDLYKSANFFVSPSDNLQETFGLTLIEAMAAGLPLIVSDFNGYREITTPDMAKRASARWSNLEFFSSIEFGQLFHDGLLHRYMAQSIFVDIDQLASSMSKFYNDPDLCNKMGKASHRRFHEYYEYKIIIERMEDFWLKLKKDFSLENEQKRQQPLIMDYFRLFSHYFTENLGANSRLKTTQFSKSLLKEGISYPFFSDMEQVLDQENIQEIILFAMQPKEIQKIIDHLGCDSKKSHYQIMWMLKHGLLELDYTTLEKPVN